MKSPFPDYITDIAEARIAFVYVFWYNLMVYIWLLKHEPNGQEE